MSNEDYEGARQRREEPEKQVFKGCAGNKKAEECVRVSWPFRDREEVDRDVASMGRISRPFGSSRNL